MYASPAAVHPHTQDPRVHPAAKLLWTIRLVVWIGLALLIVAGGPLVSAMALAAFLTALVADFDGFWRHVVRVASLPVAAWLGKVLEPTVANQLPASIARDGPFGLTPAWLLGAVGVLLLINLVITLVPRRKGASWSRTLNKLCAISFGMTEGVASVVVLFWALTAFESPLRLVDQTLQKTPLASASPVPRLMQLQARLHEDPLARALDQRNMILEIPIVGVTRDLSDIAQDPAAVQALSTSPDLRALGELPVAQDLLAKIEAEPALARALHRRDIEGLLLSPSALRLLEGQELLRIAKENLPDVRAALRKTGNARLGRMAETLDEAELNRLRRTAIRLTREVQRVGSVNELKEALRKQDVNVAARLP